MIEVFKTNVQEHKDADQLVQLLVRQFPGSRINFDLQDCDKILRVEGKQFAVEKIRMLVEGEGFECSILE